MKKTLGILLILFLSLNTIACLCTYQTFLEQVKSSDKIFTGIVLSERNQLVKIKVLRVWKGSIEQNWMELLFQDNTDCEIYGYKVGEPYVFFVRDNRTNICSNTMPYYNALFLDELNEIFGSCIRSNENLSLYIDSLEYVRKNVIFTSSDTIDTQNCNAIFYYNKELFNWENLRDQLKSTFILDFYIIARPEDLIETNLDYLIHVDNPFLFDGQGRINRKRIIKKAINAYR